MRNSKPCPKCGARDILRIPGSVSGYGAGNNIPIGRTLFGSYVKVARYLCAGCGFSEEWIDDPEDLKKLKAQFGSAT